MQVNTTILKSTSIHRVVRQYILHIQKHIFQDLKHGFSRRPSTWWCMKHERNIKIGNYHCGPFRAAEAQTLHATNSISAAFSLSEDQTATQFKMVLQLMTEMSLSCNSENNSNRLALLFISTPSEMKRQIYI